jgi:hypothetical protein
MTQLKIHLRTSVSDPGPFHAAIASGGISRLHPASPAVADKTTPPPTTRMKVRLFMLT